MKYESVLLGAKVECKSSGWKGIIVKFDGEWCSVDFNDGSMFCRKRHIDSLIFMEEDSEN